MARDHAGHLPDTDARDDTGEHPAQDPASNRAKRKQMTAPPDGVLDLVWQQRDRIEANLPKKRWRSKDEYLSLAITLGAEQLAGFEPVVDTLSARWSTVADLTGVDGG